MQIESRSFLTISHFREHIRRLFNLKTVLLNLREIGVLLLLQLSDCKVLLEDGDLVHQLFL